MQPRAAPSPGDIADRVFRGEERALARLVSGTGAQAAEVRAGRSGDVELLARVVQASDAELLPRSARGPVEAAVTAAKFYCTVNARPVVESMVDDILRFVTPGSPLAEKALEVFFVERLVQTAGREMAAGALCPFKVRTGGPWYWGSRVWTHVSTIPCFFFGGFSKTEVEMPAGALCPFKVRAGGPWY